MHMMYYETDKKKFVSKISDKRRYGLCVVAKEITVAGGLSFSFCCSYAAATAGAATDADAQTTTTADADAKM